MATPRNIDIKRVSKIQATRSANPGLDIKRKTQVAPKPAKTTKKSPSISKQKVSSRKLGKVGYFAIQASAWRAVTEADIFQLAFVRNLFSLRVLFFASLPILVYQLRYLLVLKPDELLSGAKSSLGGDNFSTIIALGLALLTLAIVSWLADSLISPAIVRFRYLQLDNRRARISRALKESSSQVLYNVWQKLVKWFVFITLVAGVVVSLYVGYVLGYGSIQQQIGFLAAIGVIFGIIFVLYFALRFWLQTITAVGGGRDGGVIGLAFKQLFYHPITSFGYALGWLISLGMVIALNISMVALVVYGLDSTKTVSLHIIILTGATTLSCILWSVWSAWQNGYWTKLVHARGSELRLVFSHPEQLKYWHFLVLVIIILLIVALYVVLAFVFADQINLTLRSLNAQLPHTFELNLPKPQ